MRNRQNNRYPVQFLSIRYCRDLHMTAELNNLFINKISLLCDFKCCSVDQHSKNDRLEGNIAFNKRKMIVWN